MTLMADVECVQDMVPSVTEPKAHKRGRQPKTLRDRVCDLALERWFEWLLMTRLPRSTAAMIGNGEALTDAYASAFSPKRRSNVEHSDSVLSHVLAEERAGYDWAASIHEIIAEYRRDWQFVLLGSAMRMTQAEIGEALGVDQRMISAMLSLARRDLTPALLRMNSTTRHAVMALGECP